jgi:LysM repeat protein
MKKISLCIALCWLCNISQPLFPQSNNAHEPARNGQTENVFYHTVERGQTVYGISLMYNVNEEDIYGLNPTSRQLIKVGEKLKIPQKNPSSELDQGAEGFTFHTIQQGETLYGLSKRFGISPEQIVQANPGLNIQTFAADKIIRIPRVAQVPPPPTIEKVAVQREMEYTVQSKETMFSLRRKFNVTSEQLILLNPELKAGLKAGMKLKIPVKAEEEVTSSKPEQKETDLQLLTTYWNESQKVNEIRIALLLPFYTTDLKALSRFQEYSEGLQMAVDSMRKIGLSVTLKSFDIGDDLQKTNTALRDEMLQNVNLIIGGITDDQIACIADFANKHSIKYVVPFAKCDKLTSNNANVFQVTVSHSLLYSYVTAYVCSLYSGHNIVLLDTKDKDEKTPFIHALRANLKDQNIPFRELAYNANTFASDLIRQLSTTQPNLLLTYSPSVEALDKVRNALLQLNDTKRRTYRISLFGYPEWQTYVDDYLDDYCKYGATIYSSFFANNLTREVQRFTVKYSQVYKKSMAPIYPKYAMMGFDTGMYFLTAISKFGNHFELRLQDIKYNSLQNGCRFERTNNWGGFINTNMYFVRFEPNNTITRTERTD